MSFLPYILVWALLVIIPLSATFLARRPSLLPPLSIALNLIALVVWFLARPSVPISLTFAPWPVEPAPVGWGWQIHATNWQLTGIVLWLALGLLLYLAAVPSTTASNQQSNQQSTIGLLAALLLPALWSATPATLITTWTLFIIVCWAIEQANNQTINRRTLGRLGWLLSPILLYASSVALAASPTADSLIVSDWSSMATTVALFAAALQMSISIFTAATTATTTNLSKPTVSILSQLLPPLIGVLLLRQLIATATIPYAAGLLMTVLGIGALLVGVWLAWVGPRTAEETITPAYPQLKLGSGLALALAAVAFLTAIWSGPAALLAATRVLVFASSTLSLVGSSQLAVGSLPVSQSPISNLQSLIPLFRPQIVAIAIAFLAIAGLPPTAGFASLAPLYATWLSGIHVLLVVAIALLLIALLALVYRFAQRTARPTPQPPIDDIIPQHAYRRWLGELAPLLLIVGVLAPASLPWREATIGTWLALFATALGGLLLPHFLRQTGSLRAAVREALVIRPFPDRLPGVFGRITASITAITDAFADAYAILESDGGLLWLLGLILLFWWIS